jgi:hypothetical protein
MTRSIAAILIVAFVTGILLLGTSDRFWIRSAGAVVEVDGRPDKEARVFTSKATGGYPMVALDRDFYAILGEPPRVCLTNEHYFWLVSVFGALTKERFCVDMKGPKVEVDPKLQLGTRAAVFHTEKQKEVRVRW